MSAESGLSIEGSDDSGPMMSWEEFRAEYVKNQRLRYQRQRNADATTTTTTTSTNSASTTSAQQRGEQVQGPPEQPQRGAEAVAAANVGERLGLRPGLVLDILRTVGRAAMASFLLFRTVSLYYVCMILLLYFVWLAVKYIMASISIERENTADTQSAPHATQPAAVHHRHPRRQPVSIPRKALYMVTRCITSFVLSLSPTYSVEKLEAELLEDGIVVPHPHQD